MPSQYDLQLGRAGEAIRGGLLNFLEGGAPIRAGLAGLLRGDVEPLKQAVGYGQPFPQLTPEQMQQQAFDVAMDINNPMQNVGGILGTFAGVGAKTADLVKLEQAKKLKAQGVPEKEIWQKTGWTFAFPDNKPRFEISDAPAKFNTTKELLEKAQKLRERNEEIKFLVAPVKNQKDLFPKELTQARKPLKTEMQQNLELINKDYGLEYPYGNYANLVVEHPELYKSYPDMERIVISQGANRGPNDFGYYQSSKNFENDAISVNKAALEKGLGENTMWGPKSTASHEMQHAVQDREMFAPGGGTQQMLNELFNERDILNTQLSEINKQLNQLAKSEKMSNAERNAYDMLLEQRSQITPRIQQLQSSEFLSKEAFNNYQRLAGEAEARLTQSRLNMTPEQRMAQYPYDPEYFMQATGVPFNELIVRGLLD